MAAADAFGEENRGGGERSGEREGRGTGRVGGLEGCVALGRGIQTLGGKQELARRVLARVGHACCPSGERRGTTGVASLLGRTAGPAGKWPR